MKLRALIFNIIRYAILSAVALMVFIPLLYTIMSAFKTNTEIMVYPEALFPKEFTLDNFRQALFSHEFNVARMFWNSVWYSFFSVLMSVMVATLSGYVFARGGNFPGSKVIFAVQSSLMFINLGNITIYAVFEILNWFHLADSLYGLLIKKFFGMNMVGTYLVRSYIRTLPVSLDEAAEIDGCSFISTFFKIILPLLKPIVATMVVLSFNGSWNEYLMPTLFTINRPEQQTLIVGIMRLKNSGTAAANWNLMFAGAAIALAPVLVIYAFCNKHFVDGLTAGAVKG